HRLRLQRGNQQGPRFHADVHRIVDLPTRDLSRLTLPRFPSMARRLAGALLTLVGVSLLVFLVLRVIPGNQITASLGTESGVLTPEQLASLKSYYGLNQPLPVQYFDWLGNVLTGNLGLSLRSGQ